MTTTAPILITSCKQITLADFRTCLIEKDMSVLGGEEWERPEAWLTLYSEYCTLLGGVKLSHMLSQISTHTAMASRIDRIESLVNACRMVADESLADELRAEGYTLDPDAINEVYLQQLEAIKARLGADRMRLDRLRRDIPVPKKEDDETERKAVEEDFELTLTAVSKDMGYEVPETINMYKYCLRVKKLIDKATKHTVTQPTNG